MTFNQLKIALYATYLTNIYGYKLKQASSSKEKKKIRTEYSKRLLKKLNIEIKVINEEKIPKEGQYLLISNHRTIIDPTIIEVATQNREIFGHWISKKELYDSFFFGLFVKNAGTILLDRESSQMSGFFKDIRKVVKSGDSVYIFPEGTRNQSDEPLGEFKGGAEKIAKMNKIDMLPVFIKNRADKILSDAIKDSSVHRVIEVEFGDLIGYKDTQTSYEDAYKRIFGI
ncbi:1-acyl-sn-glycerol-3-phosphate acyltransferase [Sulfurimonas lithotrophica]|uniref:1-acyl-sn-glycerol-3-phosphate acyltransferase n=1 Tax=Sulfurimonas lithotrophica TaxID=2590022 RepID=A0A5P8P302_9BACT|nr:lysophospholipid acyltransferase family protein [Sulfurimonas lithotrophica]QFR50089.1 1-acyl-sn-glycerol-3-phosphate acyltransferase [Sulfurimonas lithotrophica]